MESDDDKILNQGIRTYRLSHRLSPIPKTTFPFYIFSVFRAFKRLVQTGFRPDVLHAHIYKGGLPAVLIGRSNKIPVIVTEQNTAFPRKLLSKSDIFLARFTFSQAAMVLPVSAALQAAIQSYGIQANFRIVPNVADTALFTPPELTTEYHSVKKLLYVGRLDEVKGLPYLFQALRNVHQQRVDWSLDLVGDGPERARYENLTFLYGLQKNFTFHGMKSKMEIAGFMRKADLFVLPSLCETQGCVLLEAMASGLPVLSTRTGGIPEIVDPEIGVLVPPADSEALTKVLMDMLDGGIQRFNRNEIARKAQQYSPQVVGGLLHSIYQELLNDPKARTAPPGS
jgi:glycosyltransferase involved in cell wall biosynthesis